MSIEGPLSKWTNMIQGWQFRWFVLDTQHGLLSYYISKENMQKKERRGCVHLSHAFVGYDDEDDITFTITVDDKTFHLQARNLDEREKWVSVIEKTIRQHSLNPKPPTSINKISDYETDTEQDASKFDSNLVELDAYLQLLIEQHKSLEEKRAQFKSTDANDLEKLNNVLNGTQSLVETIKHAIVCLQISKVNCDPSNGFHTNSDLNQILAYFNSHKPEERAEEAANKKKQEPIESSSDEMQSLKNNMKHDETKMSRNKMISFSSSEDDLEDAELQMNGSTVRLGNDTEDNESFYDAIDQESSQENSNDSDKILMIMDSTKREDDLALTPTPPIESEQRLVVSNVSAPLPIDIYDFDEDFKDDDIDLDNQQSVITHLLTQVRIGMDLTKITLPTFILETRSLLEMYADFFAYTELFLQIPDIKCPYERMKQVVKWYMSTFRAGRKSPVAKKPYNPILGELFQCWYDTSSASTNMKDLVSDGPVPWANKDQLTFIAEQVSHHPPISAFYAEHYNKRIQLDGYTWTKSKFLGLSIGVHMVGKAVLSLIDYDEEYVLTFPSAYGRSILTGNL